MGIIANMRRADRRHKYVEVYREHLRCGARAARRAEDSAGWAERTMKKVVARSLKAGRHFDIDETFLVELWDCQDGKCAVTGLDLELGCGKARAPRSPSLDKIKASGWYTKDNTRIVLLAVNLALNNYGDQIMAPIIRAWAANLA